jgi:type II secretory pathway component PulC
MQRILMQLNPASYTDSASRRRYFIIAVANFTALLSLVLPFLHLANALEESPATAASAEMLKEQAKQPLAELSAIPAQQWFGQEAVMQTGVSAALAGEVELKGISIGKDGAISGAYIAPKGKAVSFYKRGDTLQESGAVLKEIFADHVLLQAGSAQVDIYISDYNKTKNTPPLPAAPTGSVVAASPFVLLPDDDKNSNNNDLSK